MDFSFEERAEQSLLLLVEDGVTLGELTYRKGYRDEAAWLVIEYVEVDPAQRGKGLARKLVDRFAEFVREEGTRVVAECGVARSMMIGDERYGDVFVEG